MKYLRRLIHAVQGGYHITREAAINTRRYKDSGVDIAAGDRFVDALKPLALATARPGASAALGGFGGFFDLAAAGFSDPLLVATTDGVGTKLKLAIDCRHHSGIGADLVAMCVNDLVVQGATPLFFLDYFASARLDAAIGTTIVAGIAEACAAAGCALIGGETAEMPGLYQDGDYDLAGFAVGAVERATALDGGRVRDGDVILGLASSGVHANGFSLVRRIVAESGLALDGPPPFASDAPTLGQALLTPTRLYVAPALAALAGGKIHAMAHITGGGLLNNIPRVLGSQNSEDAPQAGALAAALDATAWPFPPVMAWLKAEGKISDDEMAEVFNCGIGYILITAAEDAAAVTGALKAAGETPFTIGHVRPRPEEREAVTISGREASWRTS